METPGEVYERAIRLGKFVPKIVKVTVVEEPAAPQAIPPVPVPPPEPVQVIIAPVPVVRPYLVYRNTPTTRDVLEIVSAYYEIPIVDILSGRRQMIIVRPRQIAMYLMRTMTHLSLPDIGRAMDNRDHTTILHGSNKISRLMETNERLRDDIDLLRIKISELMAARNTGLTPLEEVE